VQSETAHTGTTQIGDERLGDAVGQPRRRPVAVSGEHEGVVDQLDPIRRGPGLGPAPVFDQPADRGVVDPHPVRAVRLGRPQHRADAEVDA
jgi:hypothetical protein